MTLTLILLIAVSLTANAQEGGLLAPVSLESAKVLPKGIRNVQFLDSRIDAVKKYNNNGNTVPLGDALNKKVTWGKSIEGKKDLYERAKLRGLLKDNNIDENEQIGETTGVVNAAVEARVPVIAYGVTSKLTMALVVPYVTTDIQIDTGFKAKNNLSKFSQKILQEKLNSEHKANKVRNDTLTAIDIKLRDNNYKKLSESEGRRTRLGDIRLISKYLLNDTESYKGGLKVELTAPTGEPTDPDKAVDIPSGDGQWDIGLGYTAEYTLNKSFSLLGFAGYTVQLETETEKRIPEESDSKVTPDKEKLTQDLGDRWMTQAGVTYSFLQGASVTTALTYQKKERDQYKGKEYEAHRYNWLESDTNQEMYSSTVALGYSTIELFRQKRFPAPVQAGLIYTNVFEGKNVVKDEVVAMQLSLFF